MGYSAIIAGVGAVAALAGAGTAAVGLISAGQQKQKAAEEAADAKRQSDLLQRQAYADQATAAEKNKEVQEANALATETAAAYAEKQARVKAARLQGAQTAAYGKAGVLQEGSPLDILAETAELEEQDILATQFNYSVQASRYRSQASYYAWEEARQKRLAGMAITETSAPNYSMAAFLKAGTSLLTTGASLAKTWGGGGSTYNPDIPGSGWGSY